jgi:hypothetical protein
MTRPGPRGTAAVHAPEPLCATQEKRRNRHRPGTGVVDLATVGLVDALVPPGDRSQLPGYGRLAADEDLQ